MGDMALPADYPTVPGSMYDEKKLVILARQVAMGIKDIPDILFDNGLTLREFTEIQRLPRWGKLLDAEVKAWEGAANTAERVSVKTASMIEEYLPELYSRLNDRDEPLMAKIKALELAAKMARIGNTDAPAAIAPGDKVQVVINLGADTQLKFDKVLPHKVIDHEPTPVLSVEEALDNSLQEGLNAPAD